MAPQDNIETLNELSLPDFRVRFWPADASFKPTSLVPGDAPWDLDLQTSSTISDGDLDTCFNIVRGTSSKQYAASSLGWHPIKKKREMRLLDMKFILAKKDWNSRYGTEAKVDGFLSFMLTYEDGIEVIYCYEVHLDESFQGKGLGKCLMKHMEDVGRKAGVKKAMLTVFEANRAARAFYEKLGYAEDDFSPPPKKLRGGIVKWSDYIILSKSLFDDRESIRAENKQLKQELAKLREEKATLRTKDTRKRKAG